MASTDHTVGLQADGTVVAVGNDPNGECDTGTWTNVVQLAASKFFTSGLRADGTVESTPGLDGIDTSSWAGIVQIAAGIRHVVGLRGEGAVLASGYDSDGQCMVDNWRLVMDQDLDGVPDNLDRCPWTGPDTAVYRDGCEADIDGIIREACPGKSEFRGKSK